MSDKKRTGTELLLSVEQKLDEVLRYVRNIDNNYKLILARLNFSQPSSSPNVIKQPTVQVSQSEIKQPSSSNVAFEQRVKTNKFEQMKQAYGITDDSSLPEETDELIEETIPQGQKRGQRIPKGESSRCGVSQIVHFDNKPVLLASVHIIDEIGNTIKKTRTNTAGRWTAPLEPGKYVIHLMKTSQNEKKSNLEERYSVEIPSEKKYELPVKDLKDSLER